MPAPEPTGRIVANFECVRGMTQLRESYGAAPLKIAKAFPLDKGQIGVCVMDSSPGLLEGDHYELQWGLDAGTRVFLTNQSYTKVHPAQNCGSYQTQHVKLGNGTVLEYLPEPVMLYRDAALHTTCCAELEPGATLLLADILCAGRIARPEAFQFRYYESSLRVIYGGELIFCNRTRLNPATFDPRRIGAWGSYTHWGNFYIFSDKINGSHLQQLREVAAAHPQLLSGVSLTYQYGIVVSILGHRAWDIQQLIQQLRQSLSSSLLSSNFLA